MCYLVYKGETLIFEVIMLLDIFLVSFARFLDINYISYVGIIDVHSWLLIYTLPSTMFTINALHKHYIHRLLYVNISAGYLRVV